MANTGIIYRRDSKVKLIENPPVMGEIVFALDTEEYGALVNYQVRWTKHLPEQSPINSLNYSNILSPSDDTIEKALTTLDQHNHDVNYEPRDETILKEVDVINNLTSMILTKPLSAEQGRVLKEYIDSINTLLMSDDTSLDEMQELVDYIKNNRETLDSLGIPDIAGLETALSNKVDKGDSMTLTLTGDIESEATFIGLTDAIMNVDVIDDSHNHTSDTITDFDEAITEKMFDNIVAGSHITTDYSDIANTLTISALPYVASEVGYINTASGLVATDVQDAIDQVDDLIDLHKLNTSNPHNLTKTELDLGNVDNTSDVNKPISTAAQTALDGKVNNSQVLTNVPLGAVFTDTTYTSSDFDHNLLTNYVSTEHIDWTVDQSGTYMVHNNNVNLPTLPSTLVYEDEVQALHGTDALRISGDILSLYKGDGSYEEVTLPSSSGTSATWNDFTATINQTTFSVVYTIGELDVFVDGIKMRETEYTASTGTEVVLNSGVDTDTWVQIVTYS